jgi:Ni/Co efflux regulator RcnB
MFPAIHQSSRLSGDKEKNTMKKLLTLLFASVVAVPLATAVFAQEAPAEAKQARWEGNVVRSSKEDSTLTVRKVGSTQERTVKYDSATKWVSQYHGDKKVNDIDASQVKDGDRVICTGTWDKSGALLATVISKRLSHSPN